MRIEIIEPKQESLASLIFQVLYGLFYLVLFGFVLWHTLGAAYRYDAAPSTATFEPLVIRLLLVFWVNSLCPSRKS